MIDKYTKGPWKVTSNNNAVGSVVVSQDGIPLAICNPVSTFLSGELSQRYTKEEAAANARLITAAPELLEVLRCIVSDSKCLSEESLNLARAVIAKATSSQATEKEQKEPIKIVYVATSGSYSDYRINAIFSTKELAEEFIATVPEADDNDIKEHELNPPAVDLIKRGYSIWKIYMLIDGSTESVVKKTTNIYSCVDVGHRIWRQEYKREGEPSTLISIVWAKTERAAIKIANEHRVHLIASGQWSD